MADFQVTNALVEATSWASPAHRHRPVQGQLYGQHDPAASPVYHELQQKWNRKRLGVKASEMESAALFVVAAALGCRCGSCFHGGTRNEAAGLDQKMSGHILLVKVKSVGPNC